jgi:hypothetical protein
MPRVQCSGSVRRVALQVVLVVAGENRASDVAQYRIKEGLPGRKSYSSLKSELCKPI